MNNPPRRISVLSLALAASLTGCFEVNNPSPGPNSPMIGNLTIDANCRLAFDYADPNGDVRGGHVCNILTCLDVPSADVTITGTTEGRITVRFPGFRCSEIRQIVLYDDADHISNTLKL